MLDQPARQSKTLTGCSQNNDARTFPILHLLYQCQTNSNHCGEQTNQPKSLHDLSLAPTEKFKMQMNRRHLEKTFPLCKPEIRDLDDHADQFTDRNDRDDGQDGPLTGHESNNCHSRTEGKRTGVTHEEFGRMDVEP